MLPKGVLRPPRCCSTSYVYSSLHSPKYLSWFSTHLYQWYNNNIAHEGRRVLLTSIAVPLANLMGVVSSNIFQNKDAPKYIPALATTAAFGGMGFILTLLLGAWMVVDNRSRDKKQGKVNVRDISTQELRDGPMAERFRWFY